MREMTLTMGEPFGTAMRGDPASRAAAASDALLMERFLAGENAPFVELYDRHNERLFIYCLKILGDRELAGDITQEMWERVLRLRKRARRIDAPLGYFLKIARNLCIRHRMRSRVHQALSTLPDSAHPSVAGHPSDNEEMILGALDALSFEHREVLILNIYCGYRFEEIAQMLGKSPEAIWKRASRARRELRELVLKADR